MKADLTWVRVYWRKLFKAFRWQGSWCTKRFERQTRKVWTAPITWVLRGDIKATTIELTRHDWCQCRAPNPAWAPGFFWRLLKSYKWYVACSSNLTYSGESSSYLSQVAVDFAKISQKNIFTFTLIGLRVAVDTSFSDCGGRTRRYIYGTNSPVDWVNLNPPQFVHWQESN